MKNAAVPMRLPSPWTDVNVSLILSVETASIALPLLGPGESHPPPAVTRGEPPLASKGDSLSGFGPQSQ
jgi:hypothetical protein